MANTLWSYEIGLVKSDPIKKIDNFCFTTAFRLQNMAALPSSLILDLLISLTLAVVGIQNFFCFYMAWEVFKKA